MQAHSNHVHANLCHPAVRRELLLLKELSFGWDGDGAEAPNGTAFSLAEKILSCADSLGLTTTSVMPCPDEGISLIFSTPGKMGVFECFNTGEMAAATSKGPGTTVSWEVATDEASVRSEVEKVCEFLR